MLSNDLAKFARLRVLVCLAAVFFSAQIFAQSVIDRETQQIDPSRIQKDQQQQLKKTKNKMSKNLHKRKTQGQALF